MKYMLLIYQNTAAFQTLPAAERDAIMSEAGAIVDELSRSGEWVGGEGLADPSTAKAVQVRSGVPAVTDGPYLEAKEHLAGYCLFECEFRAARVLDACDALDPTPATGARRAVAGRLPIWRDRRLDV